jgi:two-component system phosphate regulon response regulator OmpR
MAKILFVNDDEDLALVSKLVLEAHGHLVAAATGAEAALVILDRWRPDAFIIDYQLGDGWNGVELTRHLRQRRHVRAPIVMISSEPEAELIGLKAGVDRFIPKPFASTELQSAVESLVDEAGGTAQAAPPRS